MTREFEPLLKDDHGTMVVHIVILYKLCYYIPDACQIKILDHAGFKFGQTPSNIMLYNTFGCLVFLLTFILMTHVHS